MRDQLETWNKMRINQIAHKALMKMGKEPDPQMMYSTQLLQEFLALPIQERGRLTMASANLIEQTAGTMAQLPLEEQAQMLAKGGEGRKLAERLESLAVQAAGQSPDRVAVLLLESLRAEVEESPIELAD